MEESVFVKCDCCCSILEFQWDEWENSTNFNVSLWAIPGIGRPLNKKDRKRWCDYIMKTGKPWADHIIVSKQNARKIAEFILDKLDKYDKEEKKSISN